MIISHTFQYFRGQCLNRSESPRIKENIPDSFQRLVVYWVSLHNYPLFFRDTYKVYMVSSKTTGQQTEETITIRIVSFLGRHYKRRPRYYLVVYVDIRHSFLVSCTFSNCSVCYITSFTVVYTPYDLGRHECSQPSVSLVGSLFLYRRLPMLHFSRNIT